MEDDWDQIVRDHGRMVFSTAWRILGHAADAEDVVQEVFIEAIHVSQTQEIRHWGGLLRRLATCRALDRLRQRRTCQSIDGMALPATSDGPEDVAIGRETADHLREAIAHLPEREATVFCMRYFDDLSYQRIAEILNIRLGAVSAALHKARGKLESVFIEPTEEKTRG